MSTENKDNTLEVIAEQWVNLLFSHLEAVKQNKINNFKNKDEKSNE